MKRNTDVLIIAGPDSLDEVNISEVYEIADISINNKKAIAGTRTVGLKSRTNYSDVNTEANFLGYDFDVIMKNFNIFGLGGTVDDLKPLPTVMMAEKIFKDTGLLCSTEIMLPAIQLGCIAKSFKFKPFMIWNSSVDQLGWHVRQMAGFAHEYDWIIGLKNGKWLGEEYAVAEHPEYSGITSIEKVWDGLASYASMATDTWFIQRGCDLPSKGEYRNLPIHCAAMRTKKRNPERKMFFDPSHALGPKMRDTIVTETVRAMQLEVDDNTYLYDGILIEVGTAKCDTHQHITVDELRELVDRLSEFRTFNTGRDESVSTLSRQSVFHDNLTIR
jgi:hypothetical protein